jgi:hypothetical protein
MVGGKLKKEMESGGREEEDMGERERYAGEDGWREGGREKKEIQAE